MDHKYEVVDGTVHSCTNFFFEPSGSMVPLEINANAVLIHLLKDVDLEGNRTYRRMVTISCVNADMEKVLMEEAHRILALL